MLSKSIFIVLFLFGCGVKKVPTSTNVLPSILDKYLDQKKDNKDKKSK